MPNRTDPVFPGRCLRILLTVLIPAILFFSPDIAADDDLPLLKGPYLGQTPPGEEPELFGRGTISVSKEHGAPAFSPGGDEVFWCSLRDGDKMRVFHMKIEDGAWSRPEKVFNGANPFFSVDGNRLYYVSKGMFGSRDLKFRERSGTDWSRARDLGSPFDSDMMMWNPAIAADGTIYFVTLDESHRYHIYRSGMSAGEYSPPEELGGGLVGQGPCIAPDESYLIFGSMRAGGFGRED
ncbi:MAG TPA: hypothetical protein VLA34_09760, partial [Candidatus Krumholzibacterium sp.]|nr:hypothetical protein [Candidatus Krumholzibacterium sp.]